MDLAFIYARAGSGGAYASVEALKLRADSVQAAYDLFNTGCTAFPTMVGIAELADAHQLRVFPNPARSLVTVQADERILSLEILDLQGRKVYSEPTRSDRVDVELVGLASGTYLIHVVTAQRQLVQRLVLER